MGSDLGGADIADDRERRVIEVVAVVVELAIGFVEIFVFVLALVFLGEAAAFPDITKPPSPLLPLEADIVTFTGFSKQ